MIEIFGFVINCIGSVLGVLNSTYVFPNVSLMTIFIWMAVTSYSVSFIRHILHADYSSNSGTKEEK